ncbi:hypothetical protein LSH36_7g15018, partial [Paralvinella palmiformis]
ISHMHIGSIEKQALTTSGSPLQVHCKNFLNVTFIIPKERDCHDVYTSLAKLSQPVDLNDLYAFHYTAPDIPDKQTGWNFFDLQSEYLRMGVPNENWTLSNINKDYERRHRQMVAQGHVIRRNGAISGVTAFTSPRQ